ncbi:serine hydrolase [Mycobacterium asiaticum]|uniref:Serine hydrolase n=1 Tax=Mycobacterium asiaticum TaxID=1790 RepID=A0A1A3N4A3_MYCAS|nr:serine hydrolase [Mycobacterium asiaticum]OBK16631.1 hypothetical protein A5635_06125 [Mycobacterium asiaticum]
MAAVLATLVAAAAIVTLSAEYTRRHAPHRPTPSAHPAPGIAAPPVNPTTDLAADFTQLTAHLNSRVGLAVTAVGSGQPVTVWGDWQQGAAWSTIKVPLVIAAYRAQHVITDQMKAAITESDNAAAEALWRQLGEPVIAAQQVHQVLQQTGDPTTVESRRLRTEFTAFGQTQWSLVNQVRFTASAVCNPSNDPIFSLMGEVEPQQRWGIGELAGAQFKGGWGPSPSGNYLVRQLGVLTTPGGRVAVALAAEPASGSFDDGRAALDAVAGWLNANRARLPAGGCAGNP